MTMTVKLIKGRHFYDRLYKTGVIYHVHEDIGLKLLALKNVDGSPRFKRMVKRSDIDNALKVSEPMRGVENVKRGRGRPRKGETIKKSPIIDKEVDEQPAPPVKTTQVVSEEVDDTSDEPENSDPLSGLILEQDLVDEDFVEESTNTSEDVEVFDDDEQKYTHEV